MLDSLLFGSLETGDPPRVGGPKDNFRFPKDQFFQRIIKKPRHQDGAVNPLPSPMLRFAAVDLFDPPPVRGPILKEREIGDHFHVLRLLEPRDALSHEVNLKPIMEELQVPIIDPWVIAVKTAFMLVESGLSHSKIAYPFPPKKKINEAPSLEGAFDDILKE